MTKADIVNKLHDQLYYRNGSSIKDCADLVESVFDLVKDVIVKEGKLKLAGFGVFEVKKKNARRGRNPQTGEEMTITPRRILTFSPSVKLKASVAAKNTVEVTDASA